MLLLLGGDGELRTSLFCKALKRAFLMMPTKMPTDSLFYRPTNQHHQPEFLPGNGAGKRVLIAYHGRPSHSLPLIEVDKPQYVTKTQKVKATASTT